MVRTDYSWESISWTGKVLMTRMKSFPLSNQWTQKKQVSEWICEDQHYCRVWMPDGKGKITDAGYDNLSCICMKINSRCNFVVEADIVVNHFLAEPGPTNQEGFGLFLRETVKRHPSIGVYCSNMAAVGGYYGRFNFFGRGGILRDDISHVDNFVLYNTVNNPEGAFASEPLHYGIADVNRRQIHLLLCRRDGEISVRMTGKDGTDLLTPENNGGPGELSGRILPADQTGRYTINMDDVFSGGHRGHFYLGFFSAKGADIEIDKESFHLSIIGKSKQASKETPIRQADKEDPFPKRPFCAEDFSADINRVYYVSPVGKPSGDGSSQAPLDIYSAIERCGYNDQIILKSGRYLLPKSIVIEKANSGKPGQIKRMTGETDGSTVIDFGGTWNGLSILGDYWMAEDIHVSNGYGIRIEGSYNWLRRCSSYGNYETGFLIRHRDNSSDRSCWPCHNLIEHCCSYDNRDTAECNADGFACKVAAGIGNEFRNCLSFLNSDDGFDLFTKNRIMGAVRLTDCRSFFNGYALTGENGLRKTKGNGNGFKLGGSGMRTEHIVFRCEAAGNRQHGFTNNSNPYMCLVECRAVNNSGDNIRYKVYAGSRLKREFKTKNCTVGNDDDFQPERLLGEILKEVKMKS